MRILVAGGGVSGLATAVALGRKGHHVLVLEERPVFTGSGAGVRLAPHSFRLLDRLGVGDAVRERSLTIEECRVMDGSTGEPVITVPLPVRPGEARAVHATAHRLDVYEPLLEACWELDAVRLCPDSRVVGYTGHGGSVVAELADGRGVTGDALILAGGARAVVRDDAGWSGGAPGDRLAVYRTVVPMELVDARWQDGAATWWVGAGWHVSHYPLPGAGYLGLSATRHHHGGADLDDARVDLEQVLAALPDLGCAARDILTTGRHWRARTLPDRTAGPVRVRGRVALVGGTAEPARPPEAQGLHHALEDAVGLGRSWEASGGEVRRWLADYQARGGQDREGARRPWALFEGLLASAG
ncbi:FAD-dependent monooxygenase [Kitasatospora sp. SUK 42]|uniref:FAD-dependent monooxygenase n=1 Tax=Kitasatospora sp. SUK 42 TaxID=1588882 RepID=UPI001C3154B4|nr:FAD-dependent monooxygenase [Kitasatospora sp. SUK 42]MBV2156557.1 FAD-dependent monooxygenase [Kitasatospora sp. SUK 42]